MNVKQVREMARQLGIKNITRHRKDNLIKEIQSAEGNEPCFKGIHDCRVGACLWRGQCQQ